MKYQILLSSLVFVACSDASLTKTNALPTANITYPSDGEAFLEGYAYTLRGMVGDPDNNFSELQSHWLLNGQAQCENVQPDSGGLSQCTVIIGLNDSDITLEVFDPSGAAASDNVTISVEATEAPTAEITSPLNTETQYATQATILSGSVGDAEDAADTLTVSWTSSVDGLLEGDFNTPDSSGTVIGGTRLSEGEHLLTLEVLDSTGKNARDVVAITVLAENTDPTCGIEFPTDGDTLPANAPVALSATVFDPETPLESLLVSWSSDVDGLLGGSPVNGDGSTLLAVPQLSLGPQVITLSVEDDAGGSCESQVSFIMNTPPTQPSISLTPTSPNTTMDISSQVGGSTDADGDTVSYMYTWDLNGTQTTETTDTFSSALTTKGDLLTVTVTPTDGVSDGPTAQSNTTIVNAPPSVQSHQLYPTTPSIGDTLTCAATATDPDPLDTPTITYQWSTSTGNSHSGTTYIVQSTDTVGSVITCIADVSDGDGGSAQSLTSVTVSNTPPSITTPTITPNPAYTNDILTAYAIASDADGDPLTLTYDWSVNGQVVQSGNLNTFDGSQSNAFDKNDTVSVSTTVSDGQTSSSQVSSTVTIQNTPPTAAGISLSPSNPATGDAIQCVLDTPSTDEDGDPITYTIDWTVNGTPYLGGVTTAMANDTIPGGITQSADTWECTLTPNDGEDDGPSSSAMTETCDVILNFNGGYDYITLDPLTSMPNDKTMEAWVRLDTPPSGSVQLMSSRCGVVWISSTEISVGTINNCTGANSGCKSGYTNSTSWINNNAPGNDGGFLYTGWDGSWKHIAVTITSSELATLYIDGMFFDSAQLSADGCMSATTIGTIGRHNVYGNSLEGDIAEVRMSSAIEYTSGFTPQYPLPVTNNTEVLYGLQNDYGLNIITDDSGNGINGTLNGTTWDLGGPDCP